MNLEIKKFPELGCANLGAILDKNKCFELRSIINKNRPVGRKIFYKSKEEFIQKVDGKSMLQEKVIISLRIWILVLLKKIRVL